MATSSPEARCPHQQVPAPQLVGALAEPPRHRGTPGPPALGDYRVIRYESKLGPEINNGLPLWRVPTLLVAMSHRPASYRDWPNVTEWLSQAANRAIEADLRSEMAEEPRSTWMRLAYLLDRGGQEDLAHRLEMTAPPGQGPYYLGSRNRRGRHAGHYDVIDSVLIEQAP